MKYDDLEKTKELFEIDEEVPTPIENIEMEGISKESVTDEFTLGLTDKEADIIKNNKNGVNINNKEKDKKSKKSFKEKWNGLTKKQKIITISIIVLVLILIIALILFLVLKDDEKKPEERPKEPDKPVVIIQEENYTYKDGTLSLIDKNKKELGVYECKNKDENLCFVAYFSSEDEFDGIKYIYEDESNIERRSPIFNDNYVFISDSEGETKSSIILYNIKEQKEEGIYSLVKGFKESNYVIVKDKNNKYGAFEITSEGPVEKMKLSYDYLGMINSDSKIVAKTNNRYFIYNKEGKLESKGLNYPIKNYNNSYVVIENNGESLYNYNAKQVIEGSYDYISLLDDYVGLVKDNKLYIKDYKNNKYIEEGIELYNSYYNELNIYNAENTLTSTKYAYKISIVENTIDVTYLNKNDKEKNVTISLNDGKLSSNFTNLNYIDGKLYFYKEENKKTLLGTYNCNNKNNVDKDTKTLSTCYVASNKENTGWLPIINERYVFIIDSLDQNNKTIMLYDLKNNKTLARYASICGINTSENKVTFIYNNNLHIIAENRNNKFGVIRIEDEVKSTIGFNYQNLEKYNNYYIGTENDSSYVLFDSKGTKLGSTSKKIVDFNDNYIITIDDNKYYIFNYEGKLIDENGYLHLTLEEDYYVVVDAETKKLDIRKYNEYFHLNTQIELDTDDYSGSYKVVKNSLGYIITITKTGKEIQVDNDGFTEDEKTSSEIEGELSGVESELPEIE